MGKGSRIEQEAQLGGRDRKQEILRRRRHAAAQARYRQRIAHSGVVEVTLLVPAQH